MLWLRREIGTKFLAFLALCCCAIPCWSKCADSVVDVRGELVGDLRPGLKLTLEIEPDPIRATPVVVVINRKFDIKAYFDTFLFDDARGEHCGRVPESVSVVLLDGQKEVARVRLNVKKDFIRDEKTWNYSTRQGMRIEIPSL